MRSALCPSPPLRIDAERSVRTAEVVIIMPDSREGDTKARILLSCGQWLDTRTTAATLQKRLSD